MTVVQKELQRYASLSGWRKLIVVSTVVLFAASFAISIIGAGGIREPAVKHLGVGLTIAAGVLAAMSAFLRHGPSSRALLHPMIAPVAYLIYSLLVPLAYMAVTGRGIQVMPASIYTSASSSVMCLTVLAYCAGVFLASVVRANRRSLTDPALLVAPERDRRGVFSRDVGRLILILALTAKVQQLIVNGPVFTRVYGADQLDYDLGTTIAVAGATLTTVGCLLVMYSNVRRVGHPLQWPDWALLGAVGFISLFLLGTRSEIIAPVVLFLWFRLQSGKKFSIWIPIAAVAAAGGIFALVAQLRVKSPDAPDYPAIESLLVDTSSPILLTSNVAALVPSSTDFYFGSTYLEALKFMLPGPVARALFGEPTGTGAFAYRDLIDFTFSGQGWGFSLPTEAYLNFGFVGVVVIAGLVGWLFGRAYLWANEPHNVNRLSAYVYPLLLSYLPFGLRSDALGQMKSIIYPLLIILGVLLVERWLLSRNAASVDSGPQWQWRTLLPRRGSLD
ncbi:O-antigen polysaccharide polymerase Wzy [Conyzicola nivalis]|uniref:O-antigen polysaccharide polymerase Wzy n=1 Tax=Conyzicola nivalis TaxID=1477021 RepID=UPI001666B830|nr:O-antigen polysaccharide polymerase Wzy [Conyzicola nivalis]